MSRSRATLAIGLAAAGGVGYYLYSAGGNPQTAGKQFERELTQTPNQASHSSLTRAPRLPIVFAFLTRKTITGDAYHVADKASAQAEQKGRQADAKVDSAVSSLLTM